MTQAVTYHQRKQQRYCALVQGVLEGVEILFSPSGVPARGEIPGTESPGSCGFFIYFRPAKKHQVLWESPALFPSATLPLPSSSRGFPTVPPTRVGLPGYPSSSSDVGFASISPFC